MIGRPAESRGPSRCRAPSFTNLPKSTLCPPALPREKPGAYGQLGLADLFELREECLREFGFQDVYRRGRGHWGGWVGGGGRVA